MDSLITAAARALAAGDPIGALKRVALRDDAPAPVREEAVKEIRETILLQHAVTRQPVVVVPILVSSGTVVSTTIPNDLRGLPIVYRAVPLLPHPMIARWVEAQVKEIVSTPIAQAPAHAPEHSPANSPARGPAAHVMQ